MIIQLFSVIRPEWTVLGRITSNMETILFREKFTDWPDKSRVIGTLHVVLPSRAFLQCCGSGCGRIMNFFLDLDSDLFVPDLVPARTKEQINWNLFIILGLWILDCCTVGL